MKELSHKPTKAVQSGEEANLRVGRAPDREKVAGRDGCIISERTRLGGFNNNDNEDVLIQA